ncbi:MAG: hypothetical protein JSR36_12500 [Proteobacteria bacterium]|nr:hypothetical protein [Pseudomonadota bacterium]
MDSPGLTALVATVALLAPAWAGASASAGGHGDDACTLLTSAQVSSVLGVRVQAGQHVVPDARSSCGWAAAGDPSLGSRRLVLTLMSGRAFESAKTPVRGASKHLASGVGDDAYYITTPPFGTALSVRKGENCFQVRISGFPDAQAAHLEKAVAQKLLGRG